MRVMLVVLIAVASAGCLADPPVTQVPPIDAGSGAPVDAGPAPTVTCHDDGENTTFCAPIGEACSFDSNWFCAGALGWCLADRCREFCGERTPRCPAGQHQNHSSIDGRDLCVCVPD